MRCMRFAWGGRVEEQKIIIKKANSINPQAQRNTSTTALLVLGTELEALSSILHYEEGNAQLL